MLEYEEREEEEEMAEQQSQEQLLRGQNGRGRGGAGGGRAPVKRTILHIGGERKERRKVNSGRSAISNETMRHVVD